MISNKWIENLRLAWGEGRVELVPELFKGCEDYWESPWERVQPAAISGVWEGLRGKVAQKLDFKTLHNDGEHVVLAWEFIKENGEESAGVLWLRFDSEGLCRELRMWWMPREAN